MAFFLLLGICLISILLFVACSSTPNATSTLTPVQTWKKEPLLNTMNKPTTIIFAGQEIPGSVYITDFFDPWFTEIEKQTDGRVKIETHWGEQLVKSADSYAAVKASIVDMAQVPVMSLPNDFPMDVVVGFTSYDTICYGRSQLWWDLYQQFPEMQNEYKGTKVLWLGTAGNTYIGTVRKPVKTLEDMTGLKMMSTGGWDADRGKALGWTPVTIGPADFFTSLNTGILDGWLLLHSLCAILKWEKSCTTPQWCRYFRLFLPWS